MSIPNWLDASFAPLVDATVRGAVILLVALLLTSALRRRTAAARHAIWAGAIAAQLLLVVWAVAGPRWPVAMPRTIDAVFPAPAPASAFESVNASAPAASPTLRERVAMPVAPSAAPVATPVTVPVTTTEPRTPIPWRTVLLVLWILGAVVVLLRLAIGTVVVAALARAGARVDDGSWLSLAQRTSAALRIGRPLTLLRGDRVGVPVTWGIVYPVVLLPADSDAWPEERRQFVLVHEMAHVKRLDALTQLVGQVALALFWFNPLVWMANRRMQLEREHACDDYVLRHGTSPSQYAEELLAMVRSLGSASHQAAQPAFAALAMARRSEFEGRMLSILDPVQNRRPLSRGRTVASVLAALLVVVPLAALRPYRQGVGMKLTIVADTGRAGRTATRDTIGGVALPESFKVRFDVDTADPAYPALAAALAGTGKELRETARALSATGASLAGMAQKATTNPQSCSDPAVPGTTITSIHSDDDGGVGQRIRYLHLAENGDCAEMSITGKVTFTDAEDDVATMSSDSRVVFHERTQRGDRLLTVTPGATGASYAFSANGTAAPFDDAARRWFASQLSTTMREAAVNVRPRVARLRAQGGVDAVLRMIATIHSSGAKRAHYLALLDDGPISADEATRIVRQAHTDLASSGDLRAVLVRVAPLARDQARAAGALEEAAEAVPSSGDRTAVLMAFGETTDRSMLLSVMRAAETIPSSGDKARLLIALASRYFANGDAALREAFFRTASTVPSSGDLRRVLSGDVMDHAGRSEAVALGIVSAAEGVASSGDRSAVLLRLADSGALRSEPVRAAYMRAAQGLASSDMNRVLMAAAR